VIRLRSLLLGFAIACFSVALGIALALGPLKGAAEERLRDDLAAARDDSAALQGRLHDIRDHRVYDAAFARELADALLQRRLTGRSVVLVRLPGVPVELADRTAGILRAADATVTGTVDLKARWVDPQQRQFLEDLSSRLVTADTELRADGDAYDRAGAVLARAVLTSEADAVGEPDPDSTAILGGLVAGELLAANDGMARADLAVVLAGPVTDRARDRYAGEPAARTAERNAAWLALVRALDAAGTGTVVAGDGTSAGDSGVVGSLRADDDLRSGVSTLDVVDLESGRVGLAYALAEQAAGDVGHYGTGAGTDGALPAALTSPTAPPEDADSVPTGPPLPPQPMDAPATPPPGEAGDQPTSPPTGPPAGEPGDGPTDGLGDGPTEGPADGPTSDPTDDGPQDPTAGQRAEEGPGG